MDREQFSIEIDGEEVSDLYADLMSLEIELDEELVGMFRMRVALLLQPDGAWTYIDDERLRPWRKIIVTAGFESGTEEIFAGYITHLKPSFNLDPTQTTLEIWGMDGSVVMDREEKLKDWPNKKDSDIASEIFSLHGFTPNVDDTQIIHDEAISTVIQRETDMQFLKRLALRNGYECFVEGTNGFFRAPQVDSTPQPVLAIHFGEDTNVTRFSLEVNALTPSQISMYQIDRFEKEVLEANAEDSQQTSLGKTDTAGLLGSGINPSRVYIGMNTTTGNSEMTALCQGLFHETEWFVTGEGEITANQYEHVLKPRQPVTIKGMGETYSGIYFVSHVTHSFASTGYTQFFRVKRNAIMPTGSEDFSASAGFLSEVF